MDTRQTSNCSHNCEEFAYVLLEEARLRCGPLLGEQGDFSPGLDQLNLSGLYRDLGTAGYYASSCLEPARRQDLLAQAHRHCDGIDDTGLDDAVCALIDITADAIRAVERALAITGFADHMHLAHLHVMSACDTLEAMFALSA